MASNCKSAWPNAKPEAFAAQLNNAPQLPSNELEKPPSKGFMKLQTPIASVVAEARSEAPGATSPSTTFADLDEMTLDQLGTVIDEWQNKKDASGDLTDELQLKLQMAMERRSKLLETLSNMMKKCADTSGAIVGNMK